MKWAILILSAALVLPLATLPASSSSEGSEFKDVFPYNDTFERPWSRHYASAPALSAPDPGYYDTSEYMMGSVAVGVMLPESDGSLDPSTEDWSPARQLEVRTKIEAGLSWWASRDSRARLSFVYQFNMSVPTKYEPINLRGYYDEGLWISDILNNSGYIGTNHYDQVIRWINDLRTQHGTDWAFAVFVADSLNDPDGSFSNGLSGYAYLGGPFVVMTYDNDGYGIAAMDFVTAHEAGHIFYATDEYNGNPEYSGYLNVMDVEFSGCIMHTANGWCVSSGTAGQIGWRDTDGDGIFDILDEPPLTTLIPYSPDPTNNTTPTYFGSATVVTYPNNNPFGPGNNITISRIVQAEYSVDGPPWNVAVPSDGSYDGPTEAFRFTTTPLSSGVHIIRARSYNTEGNTDLNPAQDELSIDLQLPTSSLDAFPSIVNYSLLPLTGTASDDTSVVQVELWYSYEGSVPTIWGNDTLAPYDWGVETAALHGDGNYSFHSVAIDALGNREDPPGAPDVDVYVDTVIPISNATSPAALVNTTLFDVTANVWDQGFIERVDLVYSCDGNPWANYGSRLVPPWSWTIDVVPLCGDGTYRFFSQARDTAGNVEPAPMTADAIVTVDTVPPLSAMQSLPQYTNTSIFPVVATSSDQNGLSSVEIWVDFNQTGAQLLADLTSMPWTATVYTSNYGGDGRYDFYAHATDNAGNSETMHTSPDATTVVDTVPPVASTNLLPEYSRTYEIQVDSVAYDSNGVTTVELWYRRNGGEWILYSSKTSQPWSWIFNASSIGEGRYEFSSIAVDVAGNREVAGLVPESAIVIDTTPPVIQILFPVGGFWFNYSSMLVTWQGSDAVSGLDKYDLKVGSQNWTKSKTETEHSVSALTDGVHLTLLQAWDMAGNLATAQLDLYIDATPPVVQISHPSEGGSVDGSITAIWTGSDATSGLIEYEYSLDGGSFLDLALVTQLNLTLNPGSHTLVIRAWDNAGNHADATVNFSVKAPPVDVGGLNAFLLLGLVLLIVATIIVVIVVVRRRKKEDEPPPPPD